MNFHIFVAIITCVFYVFLRIYKSNVLEKKNTLIGVGIYFRLFTSLVSWLPFYTITKHTPFGRTEKQKTTSFSEKNLWSCR